jgi:hypothetical protein
VDAALRTPGALYGAMGSAGHDAKWIRADAGHCGWRDEWMHAKARQLHSTWTRGTFAELEADLNREHSEYPTSGVELRIKNPDVGEQRDIAFANPGQCADWIGRRQELVVPPFTELRWIWADAGVFGVHAAARKNPIRWKGWTDPTQVPTQNIS